MSTPPDLMVVWRRAQQLEEQRQRDPRVATQLIQLYEHLLSQLDPSENPSGYAGIYGFLGNVYADLPTGDRTSNLTEAIRCFQEALRFFTPEEDPLAYAANLGLLGIAYSKLPIGDRTSNLTEAIRCFQESLRFFTPEEAPLAYANTQNDLGSVYLQLPTGDRASNVEQAIRHYREALRFFTPEEAPSDYAMIIGNLGNAYLDLPTGDRVSNVEQAIRCHREALRFVTPEADPHYYAMIHSNLGNAYCSLPMTNPEKEMRNLTQGIQCYQEALRFVTPEADPLDYIKIQNNLGIAYSKLPTGDEASDLVQAIQCYQEVLRFVTPETDPLGYAVIQNKLGDTYRKLPTGERAIDLTRAIRCYQEALRFRTPETDPLGYANTHMNLADLHFSQGAWDAALRGYRVAIDVGERFYRASLSTENKIAEAIKYSALYPRAAFAAARSGKTAEALLILEQGKTHLLTEALRLRVRRPLLVPDEIWNMFEQARTAMRAKQAKKAPINGEAGDSVQDYEAHVQAVREINAALDAAVESVRAYVPHFLETIDIPTIETQILDEQTSLITFCITAQGCIGFVVSQYGEKIQAVEIPTFTEEDLHHLASNWFNASHRFLNIDRTVANFDAWQETITQVLAQLGEHLFTPTVTVLPAAIKRIIFLPSGELFFFPLHAVPLSDSSELLCDHYQISYAPSLEVLAHVRIRETQEGIPALYAVINPEEDPHLLFTPGEGIAIARLFARRTVDVGRVGTKERVLASMREQTYLHFSCHGSYNWEDPLASGLHLADKHLTLADLQQAEVDLSESRLVTLSACETGMSNAMPDIAQEYIGIPAGFLQAGVPCVISSLWTVPDLSTAMLMERFYQNHLRSGMDFVAALQEAQIWVRELSIGEVAMYAAQSYRQSNQKEKEKKELLKLALYYRSLSEQDRSLRPFAHPYYWAAFTVNGW